MGYLKGAVEDYEAAWEAGREMTVLHGKPLTSDAAAPQWLSYYQRELALYNYAHLDRRMSDYCLDRDLHPVMKGTLILNPPPSPLISPTVFAQTQLISDAAC